jgi:hypothetical protein
MVPIEQGIVNVREGAEEEECVEDDEDMCGIEDIVMFEPEDRCK